jgi:hypothetical protein
MSDQEVWYKSPHHDLLVERVVKVETALVQMDKAMVDVDKRTCLAEKILDRIDETNARLVDTIKKFGEVVQEIKITLVGLQAEIKNGSNKTEEMKTKIDELDRKFDEAEEKSKIDWRVMFKDVLGKKIIWLLSGGLITGAIAALIFIIKNFDEITQIITILTK